MCMIILRVADTWGRLCLISQVCNVFSALLSHAGPRSWQYWISELASLAWSCWNQSSSVKPPEPRESRNTAKTKAGQILLSSSPPSAYSLVYPLSPLVPLFSSSPFPKHEQFTVNSIFPRLGSHGTALEFRFVMIKWLHGIVFLRAPPSAFIRICQCRCRSASQSARLHRSSSPLRFPFPPRNWLFLMKYVAPGRRIIWLHPLD